MKQQKSKVKNTTTQANQQNKNTPKEQKQSRNSTIKSLEYQNENQTIIS